MISDEKILIVDDNKTLAKLIARKMQSIVGLSVDVAYDFAEARDLMDDNKNYFLALLDLNLPDAPYGEIVDYAISKGILVIVLTGSTDEETKKTFIEKNIVDYVYKGDKHNVDYIFDTVNRLYRNRKYKVMVVDDSIPTRNMMKTILSSQLFKVFAAAHGEEAMAYFEDNPDIKLVLTDYNMPVMNGMELTQNLREKHDKNSLIILALTSESSVASDFLKRGANDFITKPFSKDELVCRINNNLDAMENIYKILDLANKDFLTGLYNRRYFYDDMDKYRHDFPLQSFAVSMIDIDHFKKVNDTYGHDVGDVVIKTLAKVLLNNTKGSDLVSRFGGEEFCVVLRNITKEDAAKMFVKIRAAVANELVKIKDYEIRFTISIGFCMNDDNLDIDELLDKADEALYRAKEGGRNRVEMA
ncbi:diguanylate cyclase [Campylobacter sputorum subsp. bubulus]|uniref:diguanylate cyclase n=1 Tax=Campylobacter sputorum subsp. sputorum TaxID=32024 RepID=A0A381DIY8_9BACT|nr:diguanylate cyclase [Campylobacter sputorum]ASM35692.1 bile resistance regulator [Campylobacter sputorum aubsp. sputorum RM3237]KAB0582578.1 diguanylate cyclase [Campylobacter sputorum subsp. sputorum]QEL05884.1 bile resistance regulator [Campylobacter sputorum subsp. sputorum]SUX07867.1 diguanylate cyclase [Campylobacter sputorum subsp. bubulus]SUX10662.1 diguanylate cyclase [Campylobacter sputorum subsp. sputorum]